MDTRKNIYISKKRALMLEMVFAHMQHKGLFGAMETADSNLSAIIDYALEKAVNAFWQEQDTTRERHSSNQD